MDRTKLGIGVILLAISSAVLFGTTDLGTTGQTVLAGGAAVGLVTGSLIVGTGRSRRPV